MKTIQLIFRILLSPLIFFIFLVAMIIFPGTLSLLMGTLLIIAKALGVNIDDDWKDLITMSTLIIWFPILNTYIWITEAKFIE
jgi:hypothetical protein